MDIAVGIGVVIGIGVVKRMVVGIVMGRDVLTRTGGRPRQRAMQMTMPMPMTRNDANGDGQGYDGK